MTLCLEKCCCCPQTLDDAYTLTADPGSPFAAADLVTLERTGRCVWKAFVQPPQILPAGATWWHDDIYVLTRFKPRTDPPTRTCQWAVAMFYYPIGSTPTGPDLAASEDYWMFADHITAPYTPRTSQPYLLTDPLDTPWLPEGNYGPALDVHITPVA